MRLRFEALRFRYHFVRAGTQRRGYEIARSIRLRFESRIRIDFNQRHRRRWDASTLAVANTACDSSGIDLCDDCCT